MISHFRSSDVIIPMSDYFAEDFLMGKSYAISDIHAHMEPFGQFLDQIGPDDKVYVIGDVVDKGPDGLDVLFRILDDPRCILIIGNHDLMFLEQINCRRRSLYDREAIELSEIWQIRNGGNVTWAAFKRLRLQDQDRIFNALSDAAVQRTIRINGQNIVLVHACPQGPEGNVFLRDLPMIGEHYDWRSGWVWDREPRHLPDSVVVTGHTPVQSFGYFGEAEIYRDGDWIDIDCGLAIQMPGVSRMAVLCLDDFSASYYEITR